MNTELLRKLWDELSELDAPAGVVRRLLDPEWPGELSAAMLKPDNLPAVLLELPESIRIDADQLASSKTIEVNTFGDADGIRKIQVTLIDDRFADIFLTLAADLTTRVLQTTEPADGARALVHNLGRWLRLLKRASPNNLGIERQTGLFGELATISDLLAPAIGFAPAAWAWTGPDAAYQDFQLGPLAIEVKTLSATQPQQLHIQTERQLDDRGYDALVIAHHKVDRRRESGRTLPEMVELIREGIGADEAAREHFDDQLFEAGYFEAHAHLYTEYGYASRGMAFYRVGPNFPRVTEDDLPSGVGGVRYMIDASACIPFQVEEEQFISWIREAPEPADPVTSPESQHLEFKRSAWVPENPQVPSKVINEAIVKTAAGFLNADGGMLLIGLEDRSGQIVGIEPDLEHLKADTDGYENQLTTMLINALGEAAASRVRISFEEREGKTLCKLTARPSPRPVFGDSPAKGDKRGIFWARINNSTRELAADELVDYIRGRWG